MAITGKNIKNFKTMKNIGRGKEVGGKPLATRSRSSIIRTMATLTPFYYY